MTVDWLEELSLLETPESRQAYFASHPMSDAAVVRIHAEVLRSLHQDLARSVRLNDALRDLAEIHGNGISIAWADRSQGHIEHTAGRYENAIEFYRRAAERFDASGAEPEYGRTLLGGLQALIYRGQYEEALEWAARAETIFERHGDHLRLARLDSNIGNILFRQDRPQEAADRYRKALAGFERTGDASDAAATLSNLAVASIGLGRFAEAMDSYEKARLHYEGFGPPSLLARAEYNIAYLYYMRGQYSEARRLYEASRQRCRELGDEYHATLCDLDEAEMLLELNLTRESELLSRRAVEGFARLRLGYEEGKARVNLAVAGTQRRDLRFAAKRLREARRLFANEKNAIWVALVDQLRAVLAFHEKRFLEARRLSNAAWNVLKGPVSPGRAAYSQILLARLWLRAGYTRRAAESSRQALERAGGWIPPGLRFHSNLVEGEIHELNGRKEQAFESYEAARREVEELRLRLDSEDLRISLFQDKLAVYEGLVSLCLDPETPAAQGWAARALTFVEEAKSRNLADRLRFRDTDPSSQPGNGGGTESIRQDLNFVYRQIEIASLEIGRKTTALERQALELETELANRIQQTQRIQGAVSQVDGLSDADLRSALRAGELLLEFYEARDQLHVFLIDRAEVKAVCLGPSAPVRTALKLLRFQLTKLGLARVPGASESRDFRAASQHLRELYELLIAPVEARLRDFRHLILAPHRDLHGLPFAALNDGVHSLIERFTLSVIPSASVLAHARRKEHVRLEGPGFRAVVIAAPDPRAPRIEDEGHVVGAALPGSTIRTGAAATIEAFRQLAPQARILHLAAHGTFRRDNPMFSALHLADGRLNLLDLQQIRLNADLLTLSACNTGSSVSIGADELVGLMRGFLQAGARSLLVTLWEIDDASTHQFMESFYGSLAGGRPLGEAVQRAMLSVRERFPHPYFWAPFLLIGDADTVIALKTTP